MSDRLRILIGIALIWVTISNGGGGDRVVVPDVDAEGRYALAIFDQSISEQQAAAIGSVKVFNWAKANDFQWRRYDDRDDLSTESPAFAEIRKLITQPNQVAVVADRKARVNRIPDTADAVIRLMESAK